MRFLGYLARCGGECRGNMWFLSGTKVLKYELLTHAVKNIGSVGCYLRCMRKLGSKSRVGTKILMQG
jgi:hypothetical protein